MIIKDGEDMKAIEIILSIAGALWLFSMCVYWFNLDNKILFYLIRPMLNNHYDNQKRNVKL